jgi:hypothetical protein
MTSGLIFRAYPSGDGIANNQNGRDEKYLADRQFPVPKGQKNRIQDAIYCVHRIKYVT